MNHDNKSSAGIARAISEIITDMMDKVMKRVLIDDPFISELHHANKPLYAALVPDEIFKPALFTLTD